MDSNTCPGSYWSEWFSFNTLYRKGPTKLAIYGDMGIFNSISQPSTIPSTANQNIGNLINDYKKGLIDFVVHVGVTGV